MVRLIFTVFFAILIPSLAIASLFVDITPRFSKKYREETDRNRETR